VIEVCFFYHIADTVNTVCDALNAVSLLWSVSTRCDVHIPHGWYLMSHS